MLLRLFHTLRHLRPIQFVYQIGYRLHRPRPRLSPAPPQRGHPTQPVFLLLHTPELIGPRRLTLHGEAAEIPETWHSADRSDLWNYHLHYFDDLNADAADERSLWHQELIADWIESNVPGRGFGWDAYPTALRIVNWVKWGTRHGLSPDAHESLAQQARTLRANLEYHLLANHLFADAKGLFFAGLWFDGAEGERWLNIAKRLLEQQIQEQVLNDGGHFERSPMYHQTILVDLLDIDEACRGWGVPAPSGLCEAIARMRIWANWMSHPDGEIAFFNDACFGVAPGPAALEASLSETRHTDLPVGSNHLMRASGFFRLLAGPLHLLMDTGNVGPAYQPGHAHAESLAIEVSAFGCRLFVNSGVSEYGASAERLRQRSTAAHNTLTLEGQNSSDVWSGFRVGARARVSVLESGTAGITASHNGYRRLQALHTRHVNAYNDALEITDELDAAASRSGIVRWFLHPEVVVRRLADDKIVLEVGTGSVRFTASSAVRITATTWHPRQGTVIANQCLEMDLQGGDKLSSRLTCASR